MSYTAKLRIEVPAALYDVACAIARALDPDVGGHLSYGPRIEDATSYSTETPCTPEFAEQAMQLLALPEALHAVVSADYAARWADLTPPTLEECEAFCALATVSDPTELAALPHVIPA